jgi:hypothetical protein
MEFYSAIKNDEFLLFSGKWIELKIILLSETSQFHKDKYHMFSLICGCEGKTKQTKIKVMKVKV